MAVRGRERTLEGARVVVVSAAHRFSVCLDSGWAERKKKGGDVASVLGELGPTGGKRANRVSARDGRLRGTGS